MLQMIHHTITFVAITTLHLAFVTFTMVIYSTNAAIWNQTKTTTDWQDHSSGTDYQQMAATETHESFSNMSSTINNQLNVSLEIWYLHSTPQVMLVTVAIFRNKQMQMNFIIFRMKANFLMSW